MKKWVSRKTGEDNRYRNNKYKHIGVRYCEHNMTLYCGNEISSCWTEMRAEFGQDKES